MYLGPVLGQLGQGILCKYIVSLLSNSHRGASKIPINNWQAWQKLHYQKQKQIDTHFPMTTDSWLLNKGFKHISTSSHCLRDVVVGKINEVTHIC